jgi:hypothetical protein
LRNVGDAVSKQTYETPPEFITAVERRFGVIDFDLSATDGAQKGSHWHLQHFNPEQDSLLQDWAELRIPADDEANADDPARVAWLNPPFANIRPWAAKCEGVRLLSRWTLLLVPASIGTGWYADHVLGKAMVFGISRITFLGTDGPYPKDLMLCAYGYGVSGEGFWDWRQELARGRAA